MVFIFLCLLLGQGVLSYNHHINNASDLIQFSKDVNSGTSYSGTTVFLDDDIDFFDGLSDKFEIIGKSSSNCFQGIFDGQGHTISNLAINSSSSVYVGLFGFSSGGTIRNAVLDSSCSVVSSFMGNANIRVAGIVGFCRDYTIENTVNMANVSFTGSTTGSLGILYLGGIAGYLFASNKDTTVKNCANYGSVTYSGTVSSYAYIGGIVGFSGGSSSNKVFIQNCLNYGTITHSGTLKYLYIGGF